MVSFGLEWLVEVDRKQGMYYLCFLNLNSKSSLISAFLSSIKRAVKKPSNYFCSAEWYFYKIMLNCVVNSLVMHIKTEVPVWELLSHSLNH